MAKRKLDDKLIPRNSMSEELRKISGSANAYIAPSGKVYFDYGNDMMYPAKTFINAHNGYLYINFKSVDGKMIQRRVHRLVAEAYLPNPNNWPVVCHIDNDKANPDLSNLKWGTVSSNTKEAFDDGLAKNDKSWDDSQAFRFFVLIVRQNNSCAVMVLFQRQAEILASPKPESFTSAISG